MQEEPGAWFAADWDTEETVFIWKLWLSYENYGNKTLAQASMKKKCLTFVFITGYENDGFIATWMHMEKNGAWLLYFIQTYQYQHERGFAKQQICKNIDHCLGKFTICFLPEEEIKTLMECDFQKLLVMVDSA